MTNERFSILFEAWDQRTGERLYPQKPLNRLSELNKSEKDINTIRKILDYIEFQMQKLEEKDGQH